MTKKQIVTLTLSATIFTASPLFAMLDPPEKKIQESYAPEKICFLD